MIIFQKHNNIAQNVKGSMKVQHMDDVNLNIHSTVFDEIAEEIKRNHLSRNSMPKLIIGTGLSLTYGIPGMKKLAGYLQKEMKKSKDADLKEMWDKRYGAIEIGKRACQQDSEENGGFLQL